ncbi:CBS domain-containing protein [Parapedobacter composti]|uniref:CBS domain-containing protein n=1 Tax=Parapedobacter composti TaxID=623281 RepID=A0A1I1EG27_9SPHI|nr:CBS domain-containing protein [Parapedobacter composti]SFB83903.1 CBS domain-containing protein [Parapedobacter composti]
MKSVKHILDNKPAAVHSVTPNTSVFDGLNIMMERNISALLIIEDDLLQGIFTERDYARKIILQGKSSRDTPMHEVMTTHPQTITLQESMDRCMQLMTENHFRHLPVVDGSRVVGMVSIGDLVKHIIEDQQQTISQLESYINS